MKIKWIFVFLIYFVGVVYLLLPSPTVPELSDSARSDEPGDTWQHPEQSAYYTNKTRQEVLIEIQDKYQLRFFGLAIPSYRLNYRVEEVSELVRDQIKSNYFEEIVYPFRDSLFVVGWEPKNSPMYKNTLPEDIPVMYFKDVPYDAKITLKPNSSSPLARIVVWTLIFPTTYLVFMSLKKNLNV